MFIPCVLNSNVTHWSSNNISLLIDYSSSFMKLGVSCIAPCTFCTNVLTVSSEVTLGMDASPLGQYPPMMNVRGCFCIVSKWEHTQKARYYSSQHT